MVGSREVKVLEQQIQSKPRHVSGINGFSEDFWDSKFAQKRVEIFYCSMDSDTWVKVFQTENHLLLYRFAHVWTGLESLKLISVPDLTVQSSNQIRIPFYNTSGDITATIFQSIGSKDARKTGGIIYHDTNHTSSGQDEHCSTSSTVSSFFMVEFLVEFPHAISALTEGALPRAISEFESGYVTNYNDKRLTHSTGTLLGATDQIVATGVENEVEWALVVDIHGNPSYIDRTVLRGSTFDDNQLVDEYEAQALISQEDEISNQDSANITERRKFEIVNWLTQKLGTFSDSNGSLICEGEIDAIRAERCYLQEDWNTWVRDEDTLAENYVDFFSGAEANYHFIKTHSRFGSQWVRDVAVVEEIDGQLQIVGSFPYETYISLVPSREGVYFTSNYDPTWPEPPFEITEWRFKFDGQTFEKMKTLLPERAPEWDDIALIIERREQELLRKARRKEGAEELTSGNQQIMLPEQLSSWLEEYLKPYSGLACSDQIDDLTFASCSGTGQAAPGWSISHWSDSHQEPFVFNLVGRQVHGLSFTETRGQSEYTGTALIENKDGEPIIIGILDAFELVQVDETTVLGFQTVDGVRDWNETRAAGPLNMTLLVTEIEIGGDAFRITRQDEIDDGVVLQRGNGGYGVDEAIKKIVAARKTPQRSGLRNTIRSIFGIGE